MSLKDDVVADIQLALDATWDVRDGSVVPTSESVALTGGGVRLEAAVLYADLADSTRLAMWDKRVTARICKAFLSSASRLIRAHGGEVRSFDGDRVMGIFLGPSKNSVAAKCALRVNWVFQNVLKPKFQAKYEALRNGTFELAHCTGVDSSDVLAVRAGIRSSNDLIWIGRSPNIAAKLSALRIAPFYSFISADVFKRLNAESKVSADGRKMWKKYSWNEGPISEIYGSSWYWSP